MFDTVSVYIVWNMWCHIFDEIIAPEHNWTAAKVILCVIMITKVEISKVKSFV